MKKIQLGIQERKIIYLILNMTFGFIEKSPTNVTIEKGITFCNKHIFIV